MSELDDLIAADKAEKGKAATLRGLQFDLGSANIKLTRASVAQADNPSLHLFRVELDAAQAEVDDLTAKIAALQ